MFHLLPASSNDSLRIDNLRKASVSQSDHLVAGANKDPHMQNCTVVKPKLMQVNFDLASEFRPSIAQTLSASPSSSASSPHGSQLRPLLKIQSLQSFKEGKPIQKSVQATPSAASSYQQPENLQGFKIKLSPLVSPYNNIKQTLYHEPFTQ